jgi:hypothetical protein
MDKVNTTPLKVKGPERRGIRKGEASTKWHEGSE